MPRRATRHTQATASFVDAGGQRAEQWCDSSARELRKYLRPAAGRWPRASRRPRPTCTRGRSIRGPGRRDDLHARRAADRGARRAAVQHAAHVHRSAGGTYVDARAALRGHGPDYAQVMNRRVVDKACRVARAGLLRWLNKDLREPQHVHRARGQPGSAGHDRRAGRAAHRSCGRLTNDAPHRER